MSQLLRFIRAATPAAGTDRDLLGRFVREHDEEAFAAIVRRYGLGVWAACRRLAGRDAEDAFQAVFLTLTRKAASVTGSLPAWLHEVARRVAANLRRDARRRSAVEASAARPDEARPDDVTLREGLALLDEELARLPERYRAVLIVCCLEGRARDEAATQLGWTEGQVKGRLERAREMLRQRLGRRGIELGAILLAATVSHPASAVPVLPSAGPLLSAGHAVSPAVLSLTNGVLHDMLVQKIKIVATILLTTAVAGAVTYHTAAGGTESDGGIPARMTLPASAEEPPVKEAAPPPQGLGKASDAPKADEVQKLKAEIAKLREDNAQLKKELDRLLGPPAKFEQVLWHQGEGDKKGTLYLVIAVPEGDLRKKTEGLGPYAAAALKEVAKSPVKDPGVVFVLKPPGKAPVLVHVAGFSVKHLERIAAPLPDKRDPRADAFLFPAWTVTVEAIPKEAKPLP